MPKSQKQAIKKANLNKAHKDAKACISGFTRINVYRCCMGECKTHRKYTWEYGSNVCLLN